MVPVVRMLPLVPEPEDSPGPEGVAVGPGSEDGAGLEDAAFGPGPEDGPGLEDAAVGADSRHGTHRERRRGRPLRKACL